MTTEDINAAAEQLQRRSEFAAEWQATAAGFWTNAQLILGSAAAGLAAISSGSAFSDKNLLAGSLAAAAALAAAVLASLRPGERSEEHKKAADDYHALAVDLRQFRRFGVLQGFDGSALELLTALEARAVALARAAPWAPRRLERKTRRLLKDGRRFYDNDGSADPAGGRSSGLPAHEQAPV